MYTAFFGFAENPFHLTPDPRFFYLSPQHEEALNCLIYGIKEKKGFIVITGGIGNGKTTLCRMLLTRLGDAVESALIFNPSLSDIELLQEINREFGVTVRRGRPTKRRLLEALNDFLLKNYASGKQAVLLIDEAQHLSHRVLEQIRMLSNLETEREKLLQIVLFGQPELREMLKLPSLRQLNERIVVRYDLKPLGKENIKEYIEHRLKVAGGQDKVFFTGRALALVGYFSQGIPRRINALCDRALLVAYTEDKKIVSAGTVRKAARDLGKDYLLGGKGIQGLFRLCASLF